MAITMKRHHAFENWTAHLRINASSIYALSGQIIMSGSNFATSMIIIHASNLVTFGRFSMVFLTLMVSRNFLNGLVLTPMASIITKLRLRSLPAYRLFLLVNVIIFILITSTIFVTISFLLSMLFRVSWISTLIPSTTFANISTNGADFLRRYCFAVDRPKFATAIDITRSVTQLAFLWLLLRHIQNASADTGGLWAIALANGVSMIVGFTAYGTIRWSSMLFSAFWPRHLNFVKWMAPGIFFQTLQSQGPLYIATGLLGESTLGAARAAMQISNLAAIPLNAVEQIAVSRAAQAYKSGNLPTLRRYTTRLCRVTTLLSVVVLLCFAIVGRLITEKVIPSQPGISHTIYWVTLFLLLGNAVVAARNPFYFAIYAIERPKIIANANMICTAVALSASPFLFLLFGIYGIPLIITLIATGTGAWAVWSFRRILK